MHKTLKLSKEQSAVISAFGADVGVSAGAGSGKTTVLVERYLEAFKKGAWPENILAVTFTDKAANVMKERLRRRCGEEGLDELRRRLDGAWIGTIHSFCARFLKENPLECAVDPLFTVMGQGEQEMLMEKALDSLFEEESESDAFVKLLADAGEDALRAGLKDFYDKQRSYAGEKDLLRSAPPEKERAAAESALKDALSRECAASEAKLSGACRAALDAFSSPAGWPRRARVLEALYELDLRSPKTKERVSALWELAERWAALEVQAIAVPLKNEWKRLLARFSEKYEKEKRMLGTHDYEDLLVLTHRALSGSGAPQKALRSRLQKQFSFIFVDEYQDTSVLQAKIFELIKRKDNLFMVGDARQSIYRFRHAHPGIFLEALKRSKTLSLAENYRSRPEILDFVNRVFGDLFGPKNEALQARRVFKLKKEHCLELVAVPRGEGSLDAHRVVEARTLAARIRQMVDSGFTVEDPACPAGRGGKPRAARWKDFAVLLRRTTASRYYEKELEAAGIPYYANKGRGFYDKIEVADLVNFLRTLESPSENIAMASVLRSPLVQLSDDGLYWLTKKRLASGDAGLREAFRRYQDVHELSGLDRARLGAFHPVFERLMARKDRLKISELLHAVVEETAYEAKVLTRPDGTQARANVWKLIEMASALEDKSVRGVSDFIRYLQGVSEASETEAEARIVGEEEDVVRILTVHAAKGLEFPVVILADLGGEEGKTAKPVFVCSPAQGIGAKLRDPESFEFCEDAAYQAIQAEEKQKETEEADRLLYVAMTRAKEHLILSGVSAKEKKSGGSSSRLSALERWLEGTAYYRVPVVSARPAPSEKETFEPSILEKGADEALAQKIEEQLAPVVKPYEALEDLTVSRLMAAAAPKEFVPETEPEDTEEEDGEAEDLSTPRNEFGTAFHFLMEMAARRTPRGVLPQDLVKRVTAPLTDAEKEEMRNGFERFWKSEWGNEVKKSRQCHPELPFIYKTRHGILKGQMDLVFRGEKGWIILDYKTNRLSGPADKEAAVKAYSWQLGLYALAFWKLYGEVPQRTALYFSALHEAAEVSWTKEGLERLSGDLEKLYKASVLA